MGLVIHPVLPVVPARCLCPGVLTLPVLLLARPGGCFLVPGMVLAQPVAQRVPGYLGHLGLIIVGMGDKLIDTNIYLHQVIGDELTVNNNARCYSSLFPPARHVLIAGVVGCRVIVHTVAEQICRRYSDLVHALSGQKVQKVVKNGNQLLGESNFLGEQGIEDLQVSHGNRLGKPTGDKSLDMRVFAAEQGGHFQTHFRSIEALEPQAASYGI